MRISTNLGILQNFIQNGKWKQNRSGNSFARLRANFQLIAWISGSRSLTLTHSPISRSPCKHASMASTFVTVHMIRTVLVSSVSSCPGISWRSVLEFLYVVWVSYLVCFRRARNDQNVKKSKYGKNVCAERRRRVPCRPPSKKTSFRPPTVPSVPPSVRPSVQTLPFFISSRITWRTILKLHMTIMRLCDVGPHNRSVPDFSIPGDMTQKCGRNFRNPNLNEESRSLLLLGHFF